MRNSPAGEAGVASLFSSATFESDGKQIGSRSTTPEASAEQQSVRSKDDAQSKAGQDDRSAYVDDRNDDGGSLAGLQAKVNDLKVVLEGLKAQWQAFEASREDETDSYLGTAGFVSVMKETLDDLAQAEEDLRAAQRAAGVPLSRKTVAEDYLPSFTMEAPGREGSETGITEHPSPSNSVQGGLRRSRRSSAVFESDRSVVFGDLF